MINSSVVALTMLTIINVVVAWLVIFALYHQIKDEDGVRCGILCGPPYPVDMGNYITPVLAETIAIRIIIEAMLYSTNGNWIVSFDDIYQWYGVKLTKDEALLDAIIARLKTWSPELLMDNEIIVDYDEQTIDIMIGTACCCNYEPDAEEHAI